MDCEKCGTKTPCDLKCTKGEANPIRLYYGDNGHQIFWQNQHKSGKNDWLIMHNYGENWLLYINYLVQPNEVVHSATSVKDITKQVAEKFGVNLLIDNSKQWIAIPNRGYQLLQLCARCGRPRRDHINSRYCMEGNKQSFKAEKPENVSTGD